jgi:hypothetical protein
MALTEPPFNLHQRPLCLIQSPARLVRISHRKYPDPIHWSRQGRYRFDDPAAPWGVCYTGEDFETALIEVFGDRDAEPRLRVVKKEPLPDHPDFYRILDRYDVAGV